MTGPDASGITGAPGVPDVPGVPSVPGSTASARDRSARILDSTTPSAVIVPEAPVGSAAPREPVSPARPSAPVAISALLLDIVLVLFFAGLGRGEHRLEESIHGLFETAWPFLAGLLMIWGWAQIWRRPLAVVRSGIPAWLGTLILGMAFRAASGQGIALPFILVSTVALGVLLVGWRLIALLVARLRRSRTRA